VALAERFGLPVEVHRMGEGFTWNTQDRQRDIERARAAWDKAKALMNDPAYGMVVLDEMNVVLAYSYLPTEEIVEALRNRREGLHVVVTGRGAPEALIEAADLVTEMKKVKHPYREQGVKPQAGVEY
jgi:cob(I)alamin adenosyltransferase